MSTDAQPLREFFDQEADQYPLLKKLSAELDLFAARYLNEEVRGRTLAVGGVWDHFEWRPHLQSLTVLDMSERMLAAWCPQNACGIVGDLYVHEFPPASFDSVVLPLILHHTPQGNWVQSQGRVDEAVARAARWLTAEGRLFIVEWCPHPAWYWLERIVLPLTRRFLALLRQPLVVMHSRAFYEEVLLRHFHQVETIPVTPAGFNWWAWYPIFMSTPRLRLPFAIYPKMTVFAAGRPRNAARCASALQRQVEAAEQADSAVSKTPGSGGKPES